MPFATIIKCVAPPAVEDGSAQLFHIIQVFKQRASCYAQAGGQLLSIAGTFGLNELIDHTDAVKI